MSVKSSPTVSAPPDAITLVLFVAVVVMAGSNVVAVRFSNRELDPFWGAGLRFLLAACLLFGTVLLRRLPLPRGRALVGAVLYGLLGFGAFFAFAYWGLLRVQAGTASFLLASVPLLTLLMAWLHGVERFRWRALVGALVALAGIGAMVTNLQATGAPLASVLAILAAAACAAEATVLIKLFPKTHPIVTNAVGMAAGAVLLLALSLVARENWRLPTEPSVQLALVYLVLIGSFALFIAYLTAVKRWTASGMSYQFVLMPLVAFALSAWLDGEILGPRLLAGGAVVLAGVYLGAFARSRTGPARLRSP